MKGLLAKASNGVLIAGFVMFFGAPITFPIMGVIEKWDTIQGYFTHNCAEMDYSTHYPENRDKVFMRALGVWKY